MLLRQLVLLRKRAKLVQTISSLILRRRWSCKKNLSLKPRRRVENHSTHGSTLQQDLRKPVDLRRFRHERQRLLQTAHKENCRRLVASHLPDVVGRIQIAAWVLVPLRLNRSSSPLFANPLNNVAYSSPR